MSIVVICTADGTWMARDPRTGAFATGATRAEAEAELRRIVKMGEAA
ncbi:hypothetical protein [Mesorhizobium sp. M0859]